MNNRDQLIKDKLAQKYSPTIKIKLDAKNGSFEFPELSKSQILAIKKQIQESPSKEIEIFAGEIKGKLKLDSKEEQFELIFP